MKNKKYNRYLLTLYFYKQNRCDLDLILYYNNYFFNFIFIFIILYIIIYIILNIY